MTHICLLFPPFVESGLHGPHLAPALLSEFLVAQGFRASAIDLNIRLIRALLTPDVVEEARQVLMQKGAEQNLYDLTALEWFRQGQDLETMSIVHSRAIRTLLNTLRRTLFPIPPTLEDCLRGGETRQGFAETLYENLLEPVWKEAPDVLGFSVAFSEQLFEVVTLARMLRARSPNLPILLGGSQINLLEQAQVEKLVASGLFSALLLGNGESAIAGLAGEVLENPKKGRIVRSGPMGPDDLVGLPVPTFSDSERYFRRSNIPVLATRGCFWGQCAFCDYQRLADLGGRRFIARPVLEVLDEIEAVHHRYSPDEIFLVSDAIPPAWYDKLARAAIERNIRLGSTGYMMHGNLEEGFFRRLARAGISSITFGTESTNDRLLALMGKRTDRQTIVRNLGDASRAGIRLAVNAIPDYPGTTFPEAVECAKDFSRLIPLVESFNPQMFDLTAGTRVSEDPASFGLTVADETPIRSNHGYHSLKIDRREGLNPTQRASVQETFSSLASLARINALRAAIPTFDTWPEGSLTFNRSAVVLTPSGSDAPQVWLMSIGFCWPISPWMAGLLERLYEKYKARIRVGVLRAIFEEAPENRDEDFDTWLSILVERGLIEAFEPENASEFSS